MAYKRKINQQKRQQGGLRWAEDLSKHRPPPQIKQCHMCRSRFANRRTRNEVGTPCRAQPRHLRGAALHAAHSRCRDPPDVACPSLFFLRHPNSHLFPVVLSSLPLLRPSLGVRLIVKVFAPPVWDRVVCVQQHKGKQNKTKQKQYITTRQLLRTSRANNLHVFTTLRFVLSCPGPLHG